MAGVIHNEFFKNEKDRFKWKNLIKQLRLQNCLLSYKRFQTAKIFMMMDFTSCGAGETVYSENYTVWNEYRLMITEWDSDENFVYAFDSNGRDISSEFDGYAPVTGTVNLVELVKGNNWSFQCPQYIRRANDRKQKNYKVTSLYLYCTNYMALNLDLTKAPYISSITGGEHLLDIKVSPENQIEEMYVAIAADAEEIDFSQLTKLKVLHVFVYKLQERLDFSKNTSLEDLDINMQDGHTGEGIIDIILLPEYGNLKKLDLSGRYLREIVNLSSQEELTYLKLLHLSNLETVNISGCKKLEQEGFVDAYSNGSPALDYIFIGNGKVFPTGTWYYDERKLAEATERVCAQREILYGERYEAPELQTFRMTSMVPADTPNVETPSNGISVSTPSNAASMSTSSNAEAAAD